MPRELTHWSLVEALLASGEQERIPTILDLLYRYRASAYLGAMMQDAPYYFEGSEEHDFSEIADRLHGAFREDTFDPVRELIKELLISGTSTGGKPKMWVPYTWAFILGCVTHVVLDSVFHPLVVYYSGDWYEPNAGRRDEARRRHRLLEVYLDSWFETEYSIAFHGRVGGAIKDTGDRFQNYVIPIVSRSVGRFVKQNGAKGLVGSNKEWKQAYRKFSRYQFLFHYKPAGKMITLANRFLSGRFDAFEVMFSCLHGQRFAFFENTLEHCCPVTGKASIETVNDIFGRAVEECLEVFALLEPIVSGDTALSDSAIDSIRGRSMDLGVYRAAAQDGVYFSRRPASSRA